MRQRLKEDRHLRATVLFGEVQALTPGYDIDLFSRVREDVFDAAGL